jgi:hypothetical protein
MFYAASFGGNGEHDAQHVEATVSWLLRERVSGREWRFQDSDLVWEAGGFDTSRFEVHVLDERVVGSPDGSPAQSPDAD